MDEENNTLELHQKQKYALFAIGGHTLSTAAKWAMEEALSQNDPVGTVAGYYDEELSVAGVSGYFLEDIGYTREDFYALTGGSFRNIIRDTPYYPFSPEDFRLSSGRGQYCMLTKRGTLLCVETFKEETHDDEGTPMWALAVRVDRSDEQAAREAVFHHVFSANNVCESYVDLKKNTFEALKVDASLRDAFEKSQTWDELMNAFLSEYITEDSVQNLRPLCSRAYMMEKLAQKSGEISQNCSMLLGRRKRWIQYVILPGDNDPDGSPRHAIVYLRDITEAMEAEAERRRVMRENIAMDQLLQGVTRMVESFVVCDLQQDRYEFYAMKAPADSAPEGSYREFLTHLDTLYVALLNGENVTMGNLLSTSHLREVLRRETDIYKFEYCSLDKRRFKVISAVPVAWDGDELARVLLIAQDVGQKYELENLANTDSLTNLFNERYLVKTLQRLEQKHQHFTLFYLDLDLFKPVNDNYGHSVGDHLLRAVAGRLQNCIRSADLAFRFGGDEFALIVVGDTNINLCQNMVSRIRDAIGKPFDISGRRICVDVSCGYAIFPDEGSSTESIRVLADKRMYRDKENHEERKRLLMQLMQSDPDGLSDLR